MDKPQEVGDASGIDFIGTMLYSLSGRDCDLSGLHASLSMFLWLPWNIQWISVFFSGRLSALPFKSSHCMYECQQHGRYTKQFTSECPLQPDLISLADKLQSVWPRCVDCVRGRMHLCLYVQIGWVQRGAQIAPPLPPSLSLHLS
jgi:hypothetical protein